MIIKSRKLLLPLMFVLVLIISLSHYVKKDKLSDSNWKDSPAISKVVATGNREVVYPDEEMRAIWVPFMTLDMNKDCSLESFKDKFTNIIKTSKEFGANTIVVHVRPFSDALYRSDIFPWSHLLCGTQGVNPGFDPLKIMVEETHKEGMSFHAWINPLRISINNTPEFLSFNNPAVTVYDEKDTPADLTVSWENGRYYNPAYSKCRELVIKGVQEIVENYEVDAIHFDDYFYPTDDPEFDRISYESYCNSCRDGAERLPLNEWRKANINLLVSGVYSKIKSINPNVKFGISPQGNFENDKKMSADIMSWCTRNGYIDYICPQIYTNFENQMLPFDKAADKWKHLIDGSNVKLYLGIGLYKAGSDMDSGTWLNSNDIISKQIEYSRQIKADGFMLYSFDYLNTDKTKEEVKNAIKIINH